MESQDKSNFKALQKSVQIIKKSGAFDVKYYLSQIDGKDNKQSNPIKHYLVDGWKRGYEPHPCFDTAYYYNANADIQTIKIHPFLHFVMYGYREARSTRRDFFLPDFKASHPQLKNEKTNPFKLFTELYGQALPKSLKHSNMHTEESFEKQAIAAPLKKQSSPAATPIIRPALNLESNTDSLHIGRIDVVENGRISGWVVNPSSRQSNIEVEALINGIPYQSKGLTIARNDVEQIYPGNPICGFEFNIPLNKLSVTNITVSVRVKGTQDIILPRRHSATIENTTIDSAVLSIKQIATADRTGVAIIIPIYNAPNELLECLESILLYTNLSSTGHKLILSDDASPDSRVAEILACHEDNKNISIIRHTQNIGYTENINQAIIAAGKKDVVLLNSDTRVTPNWLELLQRTAFQSQYIGTVSAVSDNAGAFSVPKRNSNNEKPMWFNEAEFGRLITHSSHLQHLRIPTTSGFCMYIKRRLLDDVGLFDSKNFPRGYGEENDFCMRAGHLGWEHVLADNVLVYHERSASFLESKSELMDRASALVPKMYPEYHSAVGQAFVQSSEINQRRFDIAYNAIRYAKLPRPRVAYIIGVDSGGTPQTNMDLMSTIQDDYEPYLLLCTTGTIKIFKIIASERIEIEVVKLRHPVMPIQHDSDSYKIAIADILQRYSFELIHVRHIGRHGLSVIPIAKSLQIKVIFSIHDFYTVCPNVKLLDAENRFCGGKCTSDGSDCNVELWDNRFTPPLKNNWVYSWQKIFQNVLASCDGLITTSPYAKDLLKSIYKLDDVRFDVIPHARDFKTFHQLGAAFPMLNGEKLKVFVPGHIVPAKGLYLIKEIKELDIHDMIQFHFAGTSKEDLSRYGICHGTYKRDEFDLIVEKIKPHVGGVFSIWPETYSHTLTELWSCGIPVITSSYGATGERLNEHGGGWILEEMTALSIFKLLMRIVNNSDEIESRTKSVIDWQTSYGLNYTIPIMTACYKRVYTEILTHEIDLSNEIFVIPVGANGLDTPVTTQHLFPIFRTLFEKFRVSVWPTSTIGVLSNLKLPQALTFQYHSEREGRVTPHDLASLKNANPKLNIILELAADSEVRDTSENFVRDQPLLSWLIANSDHIIAPPTLVDTAPTQFEDLDLFSMLVNKADTEKLPEYPKGSIAIKLPDHTISYDKSLYDRMDAEVLSGSTSLIKRHNSFYVSANLTLIDWSALLNKAKTKNMISIVIPNFDKVGMTEKLLLTLTSITRTSFSYEVILVDNGSKPEVRAQVEKLSSIDPRIRVVCTPVPLMFSVGCNYGASYAKGEFLLFLNNDMEVIDDSWLDRLITPLAESDEIGIVGAKLLYGDHTVQHAGLVFSHHTNMAYHAYIGADKDSFHVNKRRQMQAVTGACLALRCSDFAKLRGFNPLFVNGCEDVDLCLRMRHSLKRRTVYIPESVLVHLEGKSPGRGRYVLANRKIFNELWGENIMPDDTNFYRKDGFEVDNHEFDNSWLKPSYRSIRVSLSETTLVNCHNRST